MAVRTFGSGYLREATRKEGNLWTAVFVIARTGSARLPQKALISICGKTVIEHLIDRMKQVKQTSVIVLCTTTAPEDDALAEIARENAIECFRGHPHDVLDRCLHAVEYFGIEFFAYAEGDEVFCDAEFIDKVIERYRQTGADYVLVEGLPIGAYAAGIRSDALRKVCELKLDSHSEGWGRYFTETGLFRVERIYINDAGVTQPPARLTLDYPEDLELIRRIYDLLYVNGRVISLREVMTLLRITPGLLEINRNRLSSYADHTAAYPTLRLRG